MSFPSRSYKNSAVRSPGHGNKWENAEAIPGAYNAGGTQTDANWIDAFTAVTREPGHNPTGASGPHFGNFTGAQGSLPGPGRHHHPSKGHPIHDDVHTGGPTNQSVQPVDRDYQHHSGGIPAATVRSGNESSVPPGTATGAPGGNGTYAGTHMNHISPTGGGHVGGYLGAVPPRKEHHDSHRGANTTSPKPSLGDRIMGGAEKTIGKLTKNPGMIERGEMKKSGPQGPTQPESFFTT